MKNILTKRKLENNTGGQFMARIDEPIKKLFKNKENFADLFNATLFHGKQVIKADKLIELIPKIFILKIKQQKNYKSQRNTEI